ncbi:unnamed protein product, partial [Musa acuminata var. zebrina]
RSFRRGVRLPCPLPRRRRRAGEEELEEEEEPRQEAAVEVVKGRRTRCARAGSTAAATPARVGGPGCVQWWAGRRARVDRVAGAGHVRRELSGIMASGVRPVAATWLPVDSLL